MFERITKAEHKQIVKGYTDQIYAFATLAGYDGDENDNEAMNAAITAALKGAKNASDDLGAALIIIGSAKDHFGESAKAEDFNLGEAVEAVINSEKTAKDSLEAANTRLNGVTALFGEKAKADDFDLVKAVGDIVPEGFTGADPTQQATQTKDETWTELDELSAMYDRGEITATEFRRKVNAVKPNKLTVAE